MSEAEAKEGEAPALEMRRNPTTPEELLDAAADAILKFGWVQGIMGSTWRGFCLLGAMDFASTRWAIEPIPDRAVFVAAESAVKSIVGYAMISWNDAIDRTKEEVVAALRRAAEHIRGHDAPGRTLEQAITLLKQAEFPEPTGA